MPNIFKRVRKAAKSAFQAENPHKELENVWPDGTWNFCKDTGSDPDKFKGWKNSEQMDDLTRGTLYKLFLTELLQQQEKLFGMSLDPAKFFGMSQPPVPAGWKPSEKALKAYAAKEGLHATYTHYVVARLKHIGALLP